MTAAQALFTDVRWPKRLFDMEAEGKYAAYGLDADFSHNVVMRQIDIAVRYLKPAENRLFFGYDTRRRSYLCPICYDRANRDWQDSWPRLAQFPSKSGKERMLKCVVCDEKSEVERIACSNSNCQSDVIYEGMCLICMSDQDDPTTFHSGLTDEGLGIEHRYRFVFHRSANITTDSRHLPSDEAAKEHARLAMLAAHLASWTTVTIYHWGAEVLGRGSELRDRVLGVWIRQGDRLIWEPGVGYDLLGRRLP